jgi:hypothetical protein
MEGKARKSQSIRGAAHITVRRDSVLVQMSEDGELHRSGQIFEVARDKAPELVLNGQFWVNLNKDGTILYSESPIAADGQVALCTGFAGNPQKPPEPRYQPGGKNVTLDDGRSWVTRASFSMDPVFRILEGKYAGLTAVAFLPYDFEADEETGVAYFVGSEKQIEKIDSFFNAVGLGEEEFAHKKNLLPDFAQAIIQAGTPCMLKISNGVAQVITALPEGYKVKTNGKAPAKKAATKTKARR